MDKDKFNLHIEEGIIGEDKKAYKKYDSIKKGAQIRNLDFNISFKDFLPFFNKPCFYCCSSASFGLDRLDSNIGYEKTNIVPCCHICNIMKSTLSSNDYIFHCIKVANYQEKKPTHRNLKSPMDVVEREMIRELLNANGGNRKKVSELLGISTTTLWRKMKQYNLSIEQRCEK